VTLRKSPITTLRKENQEKVLSVVISPTNTIVFFERTEELDNMKETQGGQEGATSGLHSLSRYPHILRAPTQRIFLRAVRSITVVSVIQNYSLSKSNVTMI
jgi:hypothetical protein